MVNVKLTGVLILEHSLALAYNYSCDTCQ